MFRAVSQHPISSPQDTKMELSSKKKKTTKEILLTNQKREQPPTISVCLWLHNIRSMHNVGSAFRTADALGADALFLSGYSPCPPRAEITKTALGAEEHVHWESVENISDHCTKLKNNGYQLIALEQTHSSILLDDFNPDSEKICIILGNEVTGVDDQLLALSDAVVEIPQYGVKHSLNVSVAGGIALYALLQKIKVD